MIQVVYSSDPQLALLGLNKVIKATFGEELTSLNSVTLDMSQNTMIDLAEECLNLPIGCDKKAVIVKNCFFLLAPSRGRGALKIQKGDKEEAFLSYLDNPDPSIYLYMSAYGDNIDSKGKYGQRLAALGIKPSSVNAFTESDWKNFVPAFFEKKGVRISLDASNELIRRLSMDYGRFLVERQKLLSYASKTGTLNLDDIKALISEPLEDKSYMLSNALTKGDVKGAFHIYNDLKVQGYDEVSLLIQLANQFRKMNMVSFLLKQGKSEGVIASTLSGTRMSIYQVRAISNNLRKMKANAPSIVLEKIYETEKSIFTGEMDGPLAFSLFLANFPL